MNKYEFYEKKFRLYNDIIGIKELRKMMGGIAKTTAYKLVEEGCFSKVKRVRNCYCIPKKSVIDFLLSPEYKELKKSLKYKV